MRKLAFWLMAPLATDEDAKDQARGVGGSTLAAGHRMARRPVMR